MLKCNNCEREFKNKSGLTMHLKNCKTDIEQETEQVEVDTKQELTDDTKRRIAKCRDAIKSCYDAEAKYRLEQEIRDLKSL